MLQLLSLLLSINAHVILYHIIIIVVINCDRCSGCAGRDAPSGHAGRRRDYYH